MISYETKKSLLRLIDSLTTRKGVTQFYEGYKILDEDAIQILKTYIENLKVGGST